MAGDGTKEEAVRRKAQELSKAYAVDDAFMRELLRFRADIYLKTRREIVGNKRHPVIGGTQEDGGIRYAVEMFYPLLNEELNPVLHFLGIDKKGRVYGIREEDMKDGARVFAIKGSQSEENAPYALYKAMRPYIEQRRIGGFWYIHGPTRKVLSYDTLNERYKERLEESGLIPVPEAGFEEMTRAADPILAVYKGQPISVLVGGSKKIRQWMRYFGGYLKGREGMDVNVFTLGDLTANPTTEVRPIILLHVKAPDILREAFEARGKKVVLINDGG